MNKSTMNGAISGGIAYHDPGEAQKVGYGSVIADRLHCINENLNQTNDLLSELGAMVFGPQPCNVGDCNDPGKIPYVASVADELYKINDRITGYNQCLEELRKVLREQLGDVLRLV